MAITPASDKFAIFSILANDKYLTEYLEFEPSEIYRTRATSKIVDEAKQQIFIYNASPEPTVNPLIYGSVYEIVVSTPVEKVGSADLAIEQILALLHNNEISNTHKLEIIDPPTELSSDSSLYQIGVRFVVYSSIYNKVKTN